MSDYSEQAMINYGTRLATQRPGDDDQKSDMPDVDTPNLDANIDAIREVFSRSYVRKETMGGLGTPAVAAALQMADPMGLSPEQLDRNRAMRGALYHHAYKEHPELIDQPSPKSNKAGAKVAAASSIAEDLNSVLIKYANWRKTGLGEPLTPQERVTQGFIDVRNPNSWF
jgi:hypothetical protein